MAARTIAGLSREQLADLMVWSGWGRQDVNRLEQEVGKKGGATTKPPPPIHRRAADLAHWTDFPAEWFTEPDHRTLFATPVRVEQQQEMAELRKQVGTVLERQVEVGKELAELRGALADQQQRLERFAPPSEANGNG